MAISPAYRSSSPLIGHSESLFSPFRTEITTVMKRCYGGPNVEKPEADVKEL